MRKFDIRNINRVNSYEWSRCNNESRSNMWREMVVKYYGGKFEQVVANKALYWKWVEDSENQPRWIFIDPEGNEHSVSNFKRFCQEHNLDDSRMYDTYNGKRKHHKKWTVKKLYGVKSTATFRRDFGRNEPPPARS